MFNKTFRKAHDDWSVKSDFVHGTNTALRETLRCCWLGAERSLSLMRLSRTRIRALYIELSRRVLRLHPKLAVAYLKSLDSWILGREMDSIWVNLKKWPRLLLLVKQGKVVEARTVISFYREIQISPEIDVTSITSPFTGDWGSFEGKFIETFKTELEESLKGVSPLKRNGHSVSYPLKRLGPSDLSSPLYMSYKAGPNGPSLVTHDADVHALTADVDQFRAVSTLLGYFGVHVPKVAGPCDGTCVLSRVVAIPDKGGKTRHIAIGDSWTQLSLYPLHRKCMKILTSWEQDCTLKQRTSISDILKTRCPKYSLDLKNATDRFPIRLQTMVVEKIWPNFSKVWETVMTRPFKAYVDGRMQTIQYANGQPMGFLSSWVVFSLTHHILVRSLFRMIGSQPIYWMIGDDVVIGNSDVKDLYLECMTSLGVKISVGKSVMSDKGDSFEFTKRFVKDGKEVSPIPYGALGWDKRVETLEFLSRLSSIRGRIDSKATWSVKHIQNLSRNRVEQWMRCISPWNVLFHSPRKPRVYTRDFAEARLVNLLTGGKLEEVGLQEIRRALKVHITSRCGRSMIWVDRAIDETLVRISQYATHAERIEANRAIMADPKATKRRHNDVRLNSHSNIEVIWREIYPWMQALSLESVKRMLNRKKQPARWSQEFREGVMEVIKTKTKLPTLFDFFKI